MKQAEWLLPVLVCLSIHMVLFVWQASVRPEYLQDYRLNTNPDAGHYVLLGRNLLLQGHYSRSNQAPYHPDAFRTPGYPLFAGLLDISAGVSLLYAVQSMLHVGACVVLFAVVRRLLNRRAAFVASLMCATDLSLAYFCFTAMSEILFLFLLVVSLYLLLPLFAATLRTHWYSLTAAGFLLGVTTLVRPTTLYIPVIAGVLLLLTFAVRHQWRRGILSAATLVTAAGVIIGPWIVRNQVVFGVPRLTTNDTVVLVYFAGAGAYQIHHRVDLETAQQMIAEQYDLRPVEEMWNPWVYGRDPATMDRQAQEKMGEILLKYPGDLIVSCLTGAAKASISNNTAEWAENLDWTWHRPNLSSLVLGNVASSLTELAKNRVSLIVWFCWQVIHTLLLVILGYTGIVWYALKARERSCGVAVGVLALFFFLVLGMSGLEAYSRFRVPLHPFLYLGVGFCSSQWMTWRRQRRRRREKSSQVSSNTGNAGEPTKMTKSAL